MPQPCCSMARIAWKCMSEVSGWISTKFQTHVLVTFRVHWTLMQMKIQNQKEAPLSIYQWSSLVCTLKPNICPELLTMPPLSSKGKSCGIKCWSPLLTDSRHTPSPKHNSGYLDLQVSVAPTIYYVCMYITDKHAALQTWNLSKDLQGRRFQGKKFTQKTRNFRHLLNRDKKCVNALNWDKTSKKCP